MKRPMTRMFGLCLVAGCATGSATSGPDGAAPAAAVLVPTPTVPRAGFDVAPSELGDRDAFTRIRHRVRLAREGTAYLRVAGPRVDDAGMASPLEHRTVYPALAESGERVRIAIEEDHARLALWIERADTAETTLAPVQLADATGHALASAGVWLGAGAPVDVGARTGAADLRAVTVRSGWLRASGFAPAAALGHVWVAGEREPYDPSTAEDDTQMPARTGATVSPTALRAAPDKGSAVIAELQAAAPARVVRAVGAWSEIEVHLPRLRARGFVETSALVASDRFDYHTFGHGRGFGTNHAIRLPVPAATCLYDGAGGEVIGVAVAAQDRYVRGDRSPGWWPVLVGTTWGILTVYVHDTSGGTAPESATLESCAPKR